MFDLQSLVSSPLFGVLLAPVVKAVVDKAKHQIGSLDRSPVAVKQALAVGVAAVGVLTGHAVAGVGPNEVGALIQSVLTPENASAVIAAGLGAIALKHGQQNVAPQPSSTGPSEDKAA